MKSRFAVAKQHSKKEKGSFQRQIRLKFKEKASIVYTWSLALYSAGTFSLGR
jgi:hypothetical protein